MITDKEINYDLVIVGAGPAGCMAALSKPHSMRALLIDSRGLPRDVICGGILSRWSMKQLADYGPPRTVFCQPRLVGWGLHDWEMNRVGGVRGDFYFNVGRSRFDAWLLDEAAAVNGVEVWPKTRFLSAHSGAGDDRLCVTLSRDSERIEVSARFLIGADGAASAVRQFIGVRPPDHWITVQETIQSEGPRVEQFTAILDRDVDFYGWIIPKDGELLVGAGYSRDGGKPLPRFQTFREQLARRHGIEGTTTRPPRARPAIRLRGPGDVYAGAGNILLAGEAAGLICPWSGEGIAYALYSGASAGRALGAVSPFTAHRKAVYRIMPRLLLDITGRKIMKRPFSRLAAARLFPRAAFERIGLDAKKAGS